MISNQIKIGEQVPIEHLLTDLNATKYIRAQIYDESNVLLATLTLNNLGSGRYNYTSYLMPNKKFIKIYYTIFNDVGLTEIDSTYTADIDLFVAQQQIETVVIDSSSSLYGTIENDLLVGTVDESDELTGIIEDDSLIGVIDSTESEIQGDIDSDELFGILNAEEN